MDKLRYMEECYDYDLYNIEYNYKKNQYIKIDKIKGGNELRSGMYNNDWSPKYIDNRYNSLYEKMKNLKDNIERKKFLKDTHKINPIDIFCFNTEDEKECFVVSDGHRRISLSNMFNLDEVYAEVTYYNLPSKC